MKWLFRKAILVFLSVFTTEVKAQSSLEIGDIFNTDITSNVVNYHKDSLNLSEYKGKKLLIDFWATWCIPCVAELKKLDSLKKIHKDDLEIVLVTREPEDKIKSFFKNAKIAQGVELPSIVNDRKLNEMFRHKTIPHEIWIDSKDSIVAITSNKEVTPANIEKFLKGEKFNFRPKKDVLNYNKAKPYLIDNNGGTGQEIISSSVLAKFNNGLGSSITLKKDSMGACNGISAINVDLLRLLVIAYGKFEFRVTTSNRTVLNVKDSSLFSPNNVTPEEASDWLHQNGLCYDLTLPSYTNNLDSMFNIMQQDLLRAFSYYIKIEKRSIDCWVLRRTSSIDKIKSKGGDEVVSIVTSEKHRLINTPLNSLMNILNTFSPPGFPYFVDQTNYNNNVDIELGNSQLINQTTINISTLQQYLSKYDLELVRKNALVDALVIYQK